MALSWLTRLSRNIFGFSLPIIFFSESVLDLRVGFILLVGLTIVFKILFLFLFVSEIFVFVVSKVFVVFEFFRVLGVGLSVFVIVFGVLGVSRVVVAWGIFDVPISVHVFEIVFRIFIGVVVFLSVLSSETIVDWGLGDFVLFWN